MLLGLTNTDILSLIPPSREETLLSVEISTALAHQLPTDHAEQLPQSMLTKSMSPHMTEKDTPYQLVPVPESNQPMMLLSLGRTSVSVEFHLELEDTTFIKLHAGDVISRKLIVVNSLLSIYTI